MLSLVNDSTAGTRVLCFNACVHGDKLGELK